MHFTGKHWIICASIFLLVMLAMLSAPQAQDKLLISYGGHNETVGPMWVAVDKGIFRRYSLDVDMLQVRNGQISLTAVMAGDVQAFWPAVLRSSAASQEEQSSAASPVPSIR